MEYKYEYKITDPKQLREGGEYEYDGEKVYFQLGVYRTDTDQLENYSRNWRRRTDLSKFKVIKQVPPKRFEDLCVGDWVGWSNYEYMVLGVSGLNYVLSKAYCSKDSTNHLRFSGHCSLYELYENYKIVDSPLVEQPKEEVKKLTQSELEELVGGKFEVVD